jgi:hypothetical protein
MIELEFFKNRAYLMEKTNVTVFQSTRKWGIEGADKIHCYDAHAFMGESANNRSVRFSIEKSKASSVNVY